MKNVMGHLFLSVLIVYEILVDKLFFSLHYPTLLIIRPVCRT